MKKLAVLFFSMLTAACATSYNPSYSFNEVQVVNLTGSNITDVGVNIVGSSRSYRCEEVAQFALCRDAFGKRRFPQQGVELSWTHPDGSRKAELLGASVPYYFSTAFPLRIMMEVMEDGSVTIFYEQEEPNGDGDYIN